MSNRAGKLFGTDGVRGEAGRFPLDVPTIRTIGTSLAAHLREKLGRAPLIVIGRDTRESGSWIEQAIVEGVTEAGAICESAGVISTPGVAFLAKTLQADAGIVISASHNPYQDNGVKIFARSGRKLDDETERLIEADVLKDMDSCSREQTSRVVQGGDSGSLLRSRYLDFLVEEIGRGLSLKGLAIVVDCANGAASHLAPTLLEKLGASVIAINNNPDGRNINRDCGSLHINGLQQKVISEHADLGVALDGDADRALFVDQSGRIVDGDAALWVFAKYLDDRNSLSHRFVVATVMSNIGLEIALRTRGISLVRADVGDKYVLDELLRSNGSLGGEQSGHIIFPHLSLAGDGMITTLCLLRAMVEANKDLHQLTEGFERFPQVLVNVEVPGKLPFDEFEPIRRLVQETESKLGDRGRLLLRYSGTEPLARVMIEGENQLEIEGYARHLATVIRQTLAT